jgi:hypothetical protein
VKHLLVAVEEDLFGSGKLGPSRRASIAALITAFADGGADR